MVNQIPTINNRVQPGVFTRVRTKQRTNAAAGGLRTTAIIGEGETQEDLVAQALGGGADGVNPTFDGTENPDGRHFQLSSLALIESRTSLFKNGIPLTIVEEPITTAPFDSRYDARVEVATGRVQLQNARLVDVGGSITSTQYHTPSASNVGDGAPQITQASLVDSTTVSESWTLRVVSVVVDALGNPITGEATLSLSGSVSGVIKDEFGNPYLWTSDGVSQTNGILEFSVIEGSVPLNTGDRFTIKVDSGVLRQGDSLSARYIPEQNLNDPELFFSPQDLYAKHGEPSVGNSLSLGAQLAFENGASQIVAVQAKPAVPRRTINTLLAPDNLLLPGTQGASGSDDIEDTIFPLEVGKVPDVDSIIKTFILSSDGSEKEIVLNKVDFYNSSFTSQAGAYLGFVTSASLVNSYTVFTAPEIEQSGIDGYVYSTSSTTISFSSPTVSFQADRNGAGESDIGKQLVFLAPAGLSGAAPAISLYNITSVGDGYGNLNSCEATLVSGVDPTVGGPFYTDAEWQLQDPADESSFFAITDDVATVQLVAGKGLKIIYTDTTDSSFFDTNWNLAYESLELSDVQFVVPLPSQTVSNIFARGKVHVEDASSVINAQERMLLIGAIEGLSPDNLSGNSLAAVENVGVLEGIQGDDPEEVLAGNIEDLADYSVANAYGDSFRVVYMAPDQIVRNINGNNTTLPGYYQAAALGGFLSGQTAIQETPTYKTLTGFTILRDRVYRPAVLNSLTDAGVLVVQPIAGGGRMLHGLTTSQSLAPEEEEISIVGIRDQVARIVRGSLRQFIGKTDSSSIISEISAGVDKVLRSQISNGLLTGVGSVSVQRNPVEPRQFDISVLVNPTAPINWIYLDMTVSL